MQEINLRDYQNKAISAVKSDFQKGVNKQVLILATGLGKTIIFCKLISDMIAETGKKALILAHREELLTQAKEKLLSVDQSLDVGIEQGINYADINHDVVIASIPTLGREGSDRINRFNPNDFAVVIVDECHHANNETYKRVLRYFGVEKNGGDFNSDILLLGVTATPSRNDNKGLDEIFDSVSYSYGIIDGIKNQWLSNINAYQVKTDIDISKVGTVAGDFNQKQLGEAVNTIARNELIVKTYLDEVKDRKTLVFAVDVAHTQELESMFRSVGVSASSIVGTTDKIERRQRLVDFKSGKIKVMVNCMTLTEGFDEPSIDTIFMTRPTKSGILFQQMIGRGTRIWTGKEKLTVYDFVDNTSSNSLKTVSSLLNLNKPLDFKGHDLIEVSEFVDKLTEYNPLPNWDRVDLDNMEYELQQVDLLADIAIPDEIAGIGQYSWIKVGEDKYRLDVGKVSNVHTMFEVLIDVAGNVHMVTVTKQVGVWITNRTEFGIVSDLKTAVQKIEAFVKNAYGGQVKLVDMSQNWRADRPSDAQLNLLRNKFHISESVLGQIKTKGDASRIIGKLFNKK